jgi:hypothetical protein
MAPAGARQPVPHQPIAATPNTAVTAMIGRLTPARKTDSTLQVLSARSNVSACGCDQP